MDREALTAELADEVSGVGESRAEEVLDVLDAAGAFDRDDEADFDVEVLRRELQAGREVVGDARRSDSIRISHAHERFTKALTLLPDEQED